MGGIVKLIIGFAGCVCFLAELENVPDWAQLISFSILMAGFIAHKGD